ncbi:MAG: IclR family transcriptional regulator [Pseudohongiella sp.]|nr:MAG: IclR family transcriptional regulator [Pseudohongiella sp.]
MNIQQGDSIALTQILEEIGKCDVCAANIPAPNPVVRIHEQSRILIIGQAPGRKVHETGVPWNDPSGRRLREWLGIDDATFYDATTVALVPMGFCYPGKGKSGDLPPRPECAPKWHEQVLSQLPNVQCTILIGQYAQNYYLKDGYKSLTERIQNWREFAPQHYVLPHPSPRNQSWLKRNPWFEEEVLPQLRAKVRSLTS